jgi:hypothetical protein
MFVAACGQNAPAAQSPSPSAPAAASPTVSTLAPRTWLSLDAFYTPPPNLPAEPGALVRSEEHINRILPVNAPAWRILYTTTLPDGSPGGPQAAGCQRT